MPGLFRVLPSLGLRRSRFPVIRFFSGNGIEFPRNETHLRWSSSAAKPCQTLASEDSAPRIEYEHIEDIERIERYRSGGYHPVKINDKFQTRYRIVHKLGYGAYSTTWLAYDEQQTRFVAVKIGIADSNAGEIDVLSALNKAQKLSEDSHDKPQASLSEAKEGSYNRLFNADVARALAAQLVLAVASMHAQGFIHGDLHLGNVLLRLPGDFGLLSVQQLYEKYGTPELEPFVRVNGESLPPGVPSHGVKPGWFGKASEKYQLSEANIFLADFGEAFSPSRESRFESHTPLSMRPPEARFEPAKPLSFSSDIWTLACAIWGILGQRSLFDGFLATPDDITSEQVDALGILPPEWWRNWEARGEWFTEAGRPTDQRLARSLDDRFETSMQVPRQKKRMPPFELEERKAIFAMLRSMLTFVPEDRSTASQVLDSEWMVKWALPQYEKIRYTK
ncbi:hypothetical protein AK830_g1413 [Neonectria ditissima]|uniref:Protein kinase domain-containing protein n=1 Tax=Neonectria ditissima TaxID=78410 RepID=A0A0N8H8P7_9HYPO|nr:hypothetical protein AK830_g1413 [Neonectria ditissima]